MIADPRFARLRPEFWANIRTISQEIGYTERPRRQRGVKGQTGPIRVPTLAEIKACLESIGLSSAHLIDARARPTKIGRLVIDYFNYRADILTRAVEPRLMTAEQAKALFEELQSGRPVRKAVPMNKQSGEKRRPAYFTGIVNMLIEANIAGLPCDYNPQELTTVTKDRAPYRTLARRIDGAFPGPVDPIAVWEIKEYYYTTTFGSRVADGVYESLLDGMELQELRAASGIDIKHYLMVDAHYTWWAKGKSYLCRIIDMLHMGYVDEVLFGHEVVDRLPVLAREWATIVRSRRKA
jgi:hypothetical protein